MAEPHWEALTPATREAFEIAAGIEGISSYYLAGGTGLALHLGHRISVDLHFFSQSEDSVGGAERQSLRIAFDDPTLQVVHDQEATFSIVRRGVGVSFFRLASYPVVEEPPLVHGVPVATLAEIGAMKLAAIIDRGTRRDLVDLYFVLQHATLDRLFEVAAAKYSRVTTFGVSAMRALAYFDDADALPMPQMLDPTPWHEMRRFLESQALEAGRRQLADLWADH